MRTVFRGSPFLFSEVSHFSTFPLLTFSIFTCHGLDGGRLKSNNTSELSYNFKNLILILYIL